MSRINKISTTILNVLAKSHTPVAALDLLKKVKANKTTIYRDLDNLLKQGKIIELDFGDRTKRYEVSGLNHHHHLVCKSCKKVEEIEMSDLLGKQEKRLENSTGFKNVSHSLEFYGICPGCV